MKTVQVFDVFTPTTPARLTFVERETIVKKITNAIRTPGKQLIVYGSSGCGKTTLLDNKLHQLYESHITSRCMKGMTIDELILNAFDQLSLFYISEKSNTKKSSIKSSLKQDYLTIKSSIEASIENSTSVKEQRILPLQLTVQRLAQFMGESNSCWVLEDFHKVDKEEKTKLAQLMKVFMDVAGEYKTVKIIAIGAVDTARQIVEYDPEMRNRVAEIHVPLMSDEEISKIINKGVALLNLKINFKSKNEITKYSNGLASVCHHLCLNACNDLGIYQTADEKTEIKNTNLKEAVKTYLEEMSDTIKNLFESSFKHERGIKYKNAELIVEAVSKLNPEGASRADIYRKIIEKEKNYPQGNLTTFLAKLIDDSNSMIQFNSNTSKYSFKDPLYRAAALLWFSDDQDSESIDISIPFISGNLWKDLFNEKLLIVRKTLLEIEFEDGKN